MANNRARSRGLMPKPVSVKRKSVLNNSSAEWISAFANVQESCIYKRQATVSKPRIKSPTSSLQPEGYVDDISPTSSPEYEYPTGTCHEFLTIEGTAENEVGSNQDPLDAISDSNSLPSTQQKEFELGIWEQSQESRDTSDGKHSPTDHGHRSGGVIDWDDCLNQLRRSTSGVPYVQLARKTPRDKHSKGSLVETLLTLIRRRCSERSMWLHQHYSTESDAGSSDRASKLFRIISCDQKKSNEISGCIAMKALELKPPGAAVSQESAMGSGLVILLMPVSGLPAGEGSFLLNADSLVLGDVIKRGDFLRIFAPWSTVSMSTDPTHLPILHSFFWVEQVRPRDLPDWVRLTEEQTSSASNRDKDTSLRIACSCLSLGSASAILECPCRFKTAVGLAELNQSFLGAENRTDSPVFDSNSFVVLKICRFWIMQKLRSVLLVQHYGAGAGLILLPNSGRRTSSQYTRTRSAIMYSDLTPGNVCGSGTLLQLPVNRIPESLLLETQRRMDEILSTMDKTNLEKLTRFREGQRFPFLGADKTVSEISLWDARTSSFRLIDAGHIRFSDPPVFNKSLLPFSRCQIDGFLLFEVAEGSLIRSEMVQQLSEAFMRNSPNCLPHSAPKSIELLKKSARSFCLWVGNVAEHFVLPCFCPSHVLSPRNIVTDKLFMSPSSSSVKQTEFGLEFHIADALVGSGFLFLDRFSHLDLSSAGLRSVGPAPGSSSFFRQIEDNALPLDGLNQLQNLTLHNFVRFSGTLTRVNANRSHVWPICTYCLSSYLMPEQDRTPSSSHSLTTLRCRCCAARLTKPKQLFEVEVEVTLDRPDRAGLVDPLQRAAYRQPRILLNMSSTRTLSLLGLSSEALASGPQINPKEILYKRLENVVGLVIRIEKNLEINDPNSVGRILVVEVPAD